jgi:uncharacterized protein
LTPRQPSRQAATVSLSERSTISHHDADEHFAPGLPHLHLSPESRRAEAIAIIGELTILAFALSTLVVGTLTREPEIGDLAINFVSIILEALPFMMIGAVIGGIIEVFVPPDFIQRTLIGQGKAAVFVAAGLGLVFPICECAIVPIVRRLINKGIPRSAAIAFLLGAPIVNPLVAASTWLAYRGNWGMVTTRMLCGYVIAVGVALVLDKISPKESTLSTARHLDSCEHGCSHGCCGHDHEHMPSSFFGKILEAITHARDDFFTIGKYLIIGAFVAGLARTVIDVEAFQRLFSSPVPAILAMMGLAVALNLCSQTDAFIAAGFRGIFPDTAQMAFMILGPMLDLKLLLAYFTMFDGRTIRTLSILTIIAVFAAMMILHYGFGGLLGAG